MKPVSRIRRDRLAELVAEAGSQVAVAQKLGKDKNQIYQWLLDETERGARNIGAASARAIETAFHKPHGWLDHDPEALSGVAEPSRHYDTRQSYAERLDPAMIRDVHAGLSWRFMTDLGRTYDLDRDADLFALAYRFTVTGADGDRAALKSAVDTRIAQLGEASNGRPTHVAGRTGTRPE